MVAQAGCQAVGYRVEQDSLFNQRNSQPSEGARKQIDSDQTVRQGWSSRARCPEGRGGGPEPAYGRPRRLPGGRVVKTRSQVDNQAKE